MRFYCCEFRGKEFFKSSPQYRCCQASASQNPMAVKCPSKGSNQAQQSPPAEASVAAASPSTDHSNWGGVFKKQDHKFGTPCAIYTQLFPVSLGSAQRQGILVCGRDRISDWWTAMLSTHRPSSNREIVGLHSMESVEEKALARGGWALWKRPTGGRDEIQGRNSPSGTYLLRNRLAGSITPRTVHYLGPGKPCGGIGKEPQADHRQSVGPAEIQWSAQRDCPWRCVMLLVGR